MEKTTDNGNPATFDDLITELETGEYKHLQIFLFREKPSLGFVEDARYLIVNREGFGLYRLHNLDYKDGKIQLEFTNPATGNPANVSLDIHDTHPDLFIVNWKDIEEMVYADQTNTFDELLELGSE